MFYKCSTNIELCAFDNVIAISTKSQCHVDKKPLLLLTLSQGDVMQEEEKKTVAAEPDTAQLESRQPHN